MISIFGFITYLISDAISLFLKVCVKKICTLHIGLKKYVLLCEKLFGDIRELWSHDSNDSFFGISSSNTLNQIFIELQNTFTVQM